MLSKFPFLQHVIGGLIVVTAIGHALDHKVAAAGILLLVIISAIFFRSRFIYSDSKKIISLLILIFTIYPLSVFASMLVHSEWVWNELDNPIRFLLVIPFFLLLIILKIKKEYIVASFILGAISIGLAALFSLDTDRVALSYGNAILMSNVAASLAVLSLMSFGLLHYSHVSWKLFAVVGFLLGLVAAVLSGTKGAWLSLLMVGIFTFFRWSSGWKVKIALAAIVTLLITLLLYLFGDVLNQRLVAFYNNVICFMNAGLYGNCGADSFGARVWMLFAGVQNILENPIIGSGLNSTEQMLAIAAKSGEIPELKPFNHLHNDLIELWSSMGLFGLLAYLGAFIGLILASIKIQSMSHNYNFFAYMLLIHTLLFMGFGVTQTTLAHASTTTYFAYTSALLAGLAVNFMISSRIQNK